MIQIVCDDIIYVINIVSANVTSTVSINSDHKKVRYTMDYYISHSFISGHITTHNRCYFLIMQNISQN